MTGAALLAFLLRHEALLGWAAVLAGAALVGGVLMHHADAPALAHARAQAAAAQGAARVQAAQTAIVQGASDALATAAGRETAAVRHSETSAHAVETAPGAAAPLPADVLAGWARGVDGLRDEAARARADALPAGGGELARAVPATGTPGGA